MKCAQGAYFVHSYFYLEISAQLTRWPLHNFSDIIIGVEVLLCTSQAFRDLPQYASNAQILQDLVAVHSGNRRMTSANLHSLNDFGMYSPTERCSSQQGLMFPSRNHFRPHSDSISENLLSDSFGNNAFGSSPTTIQMSFHNWQRGQPKVFVAHMPRGMTRRDLSEYFNLFGAVLDIYMSQPWDILPEQGGFAFVSFQSRASIQVRPCA